MVDTATAADPRRSHVLTIAVEDYFQAAALRGAVTPRQWSRFERRVERNTRAALDLLEATGSRATFFVVGWIADQLPELVREIVRRGHEVASKGYHHRAIREMTPEQFREDLVRSREAIERAGGRQVLGYRIARDSFGLEDLWALDVLAQEGFAYDSSIYPRLRSLGSEGWRSTPFQHKSGDRVLWEVPLTSLHVAGLFFPFAGGAYFRQLPHGMATAVLRRWNRRREAPFVLHFHVWELDTDLPEITAAGRISTVRQHRNLREMPARLQEHLREYRFVGIAEHLGLTQGEVTVPARVPAPEVVPATTLAAHERLPVTVVVPCYNEELVLPYLSNTLEDVKRNLAGAYDLRFLFVDDGSTDETWSQLERIFGSRPDCSLWKQPRNMGVAAAIMAGIREAKTEVVCSIDCDCTYDPMQLQGMLPLLDDDVALVTASPYHPLGGVMNVPPWRLFLSRGLSRLYRRVLGQKLATFTSCFRVYRRSAMLDLELEEGGFLGVAEMIGLLSMKRARIAEQPAVLEVRMLGRSKMKIVRTIFGHLGLLARFASLRLKRRWSAPASSEAVAVEDPSVVAEAGEAKQGRR